MDPVKVIIFVAAFVLLLLLGKKLSSSSDVYASSPEFHPPEPQPLPVSVVEEDEEEEKSAVKAPAVVGSELPFPVSLPPVTRGEDGRYNRPNILNYFFREIDLATGPPDKRSFCDELTVETQDPDYGHYYTYKFSVATPAGLQKMLDEGHLASLYLDAEVVVVAAWDMKVILGTVIEEIIKLYKEPREA